jgi:hypothetical protein
MRSWLREDLGIVERADLDLVGLRKWFEEIYTDGEVWSEYLPGEIRRQFFEEAKRVYLQAKTMEKKQMVLVKVRHTKDVVQAGFEIACGEKEITWNMTTVVVACFLHDIGRFGQALFGSYRDRETGFDHGIEGAKVVRRMDWRALINLDVDQEEVAEAVAQHNKLEVTKIGIYVSLVRDADKLALLRYSKLYLDNFCQKADGVTETALADFLAGKIVSNENVSTRNDVCLNWLSWERDLNFLTTRKLFEVEGVKEWMLEDIRRRDPELWPRISGAS